jgi:hypothetical protein
LASWHVDCFIEQSQLKSRLTTMDEGRGPQASLSKVALLSLLAILAATRRRLRPFLDDARLLEADCASGRAQRAVSDALGRPRA